MLKEPSIRNTLTIAGSDSSGGAGIQADLKTFAALGCYGASALTALTAQNTLGVQGVHPVPPAFVEQQIQSVVDDLTIDAIKTGMLYDTEITEAVVWALKKNPGLAKAPLVCDPVCVSTSGHTLLESKAISVMVKELFPLATLVTPNKAEAEVLLSYYGNATTISDLDGMALAASLLLSLGPKSVLLKGGHLPINNDMVSQLSQKRPDLKIIRQCLPEEHMEILRIGTENDEPQDLVADILCEEGKGLVLFVRPRIESKNTHGTGCTLSAALACELARGATLEQATNAATLYTYFGIETAQDNGTGNGPLNHLHAISRLSVPRPSTRNPYPLTQHFIRSNLQAWNDYVGHEFVKLLGKGVLPPKHFVKFIKQDYIYLRYYARAYALLAAKSTSYSAIEVATKTIMNVINEISTHKSFCAKFGVDDVALERTAEEPATTAYGSYLIDIGLQGDTAKLLVALLACLLGYGEVGLWLKKEAQSANSWVKLEGNPYLQWIEDYSGTVYQTAVKIGLDIIEAQAVADPPSPSRLLEWQGVWGRCTLLEKGFWDMSLS